MKTIVFGGAFAPPHREHVKMCESAMKELGAERLVLVPTYLPAHKTEHYLSFEDRCALVKIAFKDVCGEVVVDDVERRRGEDNYSYLVLPILKEKYGDIVYLIGSDSLEYFDKWKEPQRVATACKIAVCSREGYAGADEVVKLVGTKYGVENFIPLEHVGGDVSSSMIKTKLLLGEDADELPDGVNEYIKTHGLFDDYIEFVERLKSYQTDELFFHSKSVVKRAVEFNSKHILLQDYDKVFLAALLHDNAKQRKSLDGLNVPEDAVGTPVLHQFLGAEKARRDFGIEDEEILNAIRYHTTAKANMTMLEKLIYTADSLSDDRTYEPIPELRKIAIADFEKGFKAILKYTYDKIAERGTGMYPLTEDAYRYYILEDRD
ncbi:MAG: nicotinate (nicotinamide) nucleotide adenylyltransferase [Clostridia bacterium]|nr:nicotinate (nicotinamide) nucleotide adenylyltransferase [Clostridia bacterium]